MVQTRAKVIVALGRGVARVEVCKAGLHLAGALCALSISVGAGAAEPDTLSPLQLSYTAPTGCGSAAEVREKLRDALGKSAEPVPQTSVDIVVKRSSERVLLEYRAQQGTVASRRSLVLDSCQAASEASALLLLLTLDPLLAESLGAAKAVELKRAPETPPTPPESASPLTSAAPEEAPAPIESATPRETTPPKTPTKATAPIAPESASPPTREPSERTPWRSNGWLGLGGSMVTAITPRVAMGAGLDGGVRLGLIKVGARLAFARGLERTLDAPAGAVVRSSVLRAHLSSALDFGQSAFHFGPWVSFGWEYLSSDISHISDPSPGATPLLSAAGGAEIELVITEHWGAFARAGAVLPLERPRFRVEGLEGLVHQPAALGADLSLGILWAWGSQK